MFKLNSDLIYDDSLALTSPSQMLFKIFSPYVDSQASSIQVFTAK